MPKNGPKSPLTGPYHCLFIFFPKYYGSSEYSTSLATPPDPIKYFWRIIEAPICPKYAQKNKNPLPTGENGAIKITLQF